MRLHYWSPTIILCGLMALALPDGVSGQAALIFETTFNCPEWSQASTADPCSIGDGVARGGNWTVSSGKSDQITLAANNPSGGGGKGFRHWRGTGTNNTGGGLRITFPPTSQLWVRWTARFSSGFQWQNGAPAYAKELYFDPGAIGALIPGFANGTFELHTTAGSQTFRSSKSWAAINGGSLGDGRFHTYQVYVKLDTNGSNGAAKLWVDEQLVGDFSGLDFGTRGPMSSFSLGENQSYVLNGDHYTDYDDVAVSATGYIGSALTVPLPAAPRNVRIMR